jgi:hypothetical protein
MDAETVTFRLLFALAIKCRVKQNQLLIRSSRFKKNGNTVRNTLKRPIIEGVLLNALQLALQELHRSLCCSNGAILMSLQPLVPAGGVCVCE